MRGLLPSVAHEPLVQVHPHLRVGATRQRSPLHVRLRADLARQLSPRARPQVGRAGRDGEAASCHLFLDDADFLRLRSLAHTDGVDAAAVASFLRSVFDAETEVRGCIVCW
jgi:hypothetical protein